MTERGLYMRKKEKTRLIYFQDLEEKPKYGGESNRAGSHPLLDLTLKNL